MTDDFASYETGLSAPASAAETITPSDTLELEFTTRALFVGQDGDVVVTMKSGDNVTLRNLQGGVVYPLRVTHVLATGTTATDLVGLR